MASRSSYLKSKNKSRGEDVEFVPVRSNVFYGIQTRVIDEQKSSSERNIKISPNITFYDNYTKAFIDFSDYLNNPLTSDVKSFFDLLINGLNFTISEAIWLNPVVDKKSFNLGGTYKFIKFVDNIVFTEVVSIDSYSTKITRYDKSNFDSTPNIQFITTITPTKKETRSYIFNFLGKNSKSSFAYIGLQKGDYLQIQNNDQKYKVESYSIDSEGKETLVVLGELPTENNIGTPILFTLYVKNFNKIQLNYDNNILGKCELNKNNTSLICISNHTELQSKLRENSFELITSTFFPNQFCETVQSTPTEETLRNEIIKTIAARNQIEIRNTTLQNNLPLTTSRVDFLTNLFK